VTRAIGFLIFPDFQLLDAAGPISAFEVGGRVADDPYELRVFASVPGEVASSSGVRMSAVGLAAAEGLDTLIVVGGHGVREPATDPTVIALLRDAAVRCRRVASVCSGAYVLAAAGLLDGRPATTHWNSTDDFARRFPKVRVLPDRIYTRDDKFWTSAGISAGVDLALAMVGEDFGEAVARRSAQQLVVYHRRPGGQSQFSALLEMERADGRFGPLLAWARERLAEPLTVEQLADQAAMSPRHFARAFTAETGLTPAKAVERLRVEAARHAVEQGGEPIDILATRVGFGDPERMRRAFLRAFGQPPQALRRAARRA
jgi:transcriptional regulator GlxA family with amidase domain